MKEVSFQNVECDSEVILEGGELQKYLSQLSTDGDYDVYKPKIRGVTSETFASLKLKSISEDSAVLISAILNSGLLLEEDAFDLHKAYCDLLIEERKWRKYVPVLIFGSLTASFYILLPDCGIHKYFFVICFLLVLSFVIVNGASYFSVIAHKRKLKKLLKIFSEANCSIRRNIRIIKEENSCLFTKGLLDKMRRGSELKQDVFFSVKENEILHFALKLNDALKSLISFIRKATLSLLKITPDVHVTMSPRYISLLTEEQLGLGSFISNEEPIGNIVTLLEKSKNIFILLMSEFLRILGHQISTNNGVGRLDIFITIDNCYNEFEIIFSFLRKLNNYILSSNESLTVKKNVCKELFDGYSHCHRVLCAVNSIRVELIEIKNYLETFHSSNIHADLKSFGQISHSKLIDIERSFTDTFQLLKITQNYFANFTKDYKFSTNLISPKDNDSVLMTDTSSSPLLNKTGITVGFSDFSCSGIDEVFLGVSEGAENNSTSFENNISCSSVPPRFLIEELKTALISKREEFKVRERKALKNTDLDSLIEENDEHDKEILCFANEIDSEQKKEQNLDVPISSSVYKILPEFSFDNDSCGTLFQSRLALEAVNVSSEWNKNKNIEYFLDSD